MKQTIQRMFCMCLRPSKIFKRRSNISGSRSWYQMKGLARRNTHMKYETPCTYQSNGMTKVKVFESRSNSKFKGQRVKIMVSKERPHNTKTHVKYETPCTYQSKGMTKVKVLKVSQTPSSKVRGSRSWYQMKGLTIRNTHVKYEPLASAIKSYDQG